jgi:hypothetical protein
VTIALDFLKPFAASNQTVFDLAPSGASTQVTWTMKGNNNFVAKFFGLFMDMDKMVGPDFEKGLGMLKQQAEAEAARQAEEARRAASSAAADSAAAAAAASGAAGTAPAGDAPPSRPVPILVR